MTGFFRVFSGEILKLKRTLALRLAVSAPAVIVILVFGIYLERGEQFAEGGDPLQGFAQLILTIWSIVVFPLFAALIAALLAGIEHQSEGWKQVFTLPVGRRGIFAAKWLTGLSLLLVSCLVVAVGASVTSEVLRISKPGWEHAALPVRLIFRGNALSLGAAGLLFSIQMWISLRWRSFLPGVIVAVLALAVMFISVPRGAAVFGSFFPWSLPAMAMAPVNPYRGLVVSWGMAGGILVGFLACWELARREFR